MTTTMDLEPSTTPVAATPWWERWSTPAVHAGVVAALVWVPWQDWSSLEQMGLRKQYAAMMAGGVVAVVAVLLARRSPAWATLLAATPFLGLTVMPWFMWGWLVALASVASIAALAGWRRAVLPTTAALGVVVMYCTTTVGAVLPLWSTTRTAGDRVECCNGSLAWAGLDARVLPVLAAHVVAILGVVGISWAIGSARRARVAAATAERARQEALVVESVAGERARVARDLHDVVAHHVSLIAVRAESAPFQHPHIDPDAREVLAAVAEDARSALGELRQVLAVLQRSEGMVAERAPQPGADDVETLLADARSAGQEVEVTGAWGAVPATQGYVLFRVVQEALSNARRHAPGADVTLERRRPDGAVGVTLVNVCDVAGPPGRGLAGMRERVEAVGGSLSAERVGDRFVVEVEIPLEEVL